MAKTDPFLLNQHLKHSELKCNTGLIVLWCGSYGWQLELIATADLEPFEGAVVAVQQQHGQRGELSRSIPAIAAVNHHWMSTGNFISHLDRPWQHQLPSQSKHQKSNCLPERNPKCGVTAPQKPAELKCTFTCSSQCVDSRLDSQWDSSTLG